MFTPPARTSSGCIPKANGEDREPWASRPRGTAPCRPALKLILEPIFEADFQPFSYGFRPRPVGAQDAIAEIYNFTSTIRMSGCWRPTSTACFDEHRRIRPYWIRCAGAVGDRRVVALVKSVSQRRHPFRGRRHASRRTPGTPQGGILHRLANIALRLDDISRGWFGQQPPQLAAARAATYRLVRMRTTSWSWWRTRAARTAGRGGGRPMPMACACRMRRPSPHRRGLHLPWLAHPAQTVRSKKRFVYTWPSKKALASSRPRSRRAPAVTNTRSPISFATELCASGGPLLPYGSRPPSIPAPVHLARSVGCAHRANWKSFDGATTPGGGPTAAGGRARRRRRRRRRGRPWPPCGPGRRGAPHGVGGALRRAGRRDR